MRSMSLWAGLALAASSVAANAAPSMLSEGFDNVGMLNANGWLVVNNSTQPQGGAWFQGNSSQFVADSGAANSYIGSNFLAAAPGGSISLWLITPEIDFSLGNNAVSFALRGNPSGLFPDSIEVHYSTTGSSVGATTTSTGDFSLLKRYDFNTDPGGWVRDTLILDRQSGNGRYAFRYVVGDTNLAGDYVGIDSFSAQIPEPGSLALVSLSLFSLLAASRGRPRV